MKKLLRNAFVYVT